MERSEKEIANPLERSEKEIANPLEQSEKEVEMFKKIALGKK